MISYMSTPAEVLATCTVLISAVSAIAAALGLMLNAFAARRTEHWVRLRYASDVVDKLFDDKILRLAVLFIDWRKREIQLPEGLEKYGNNGLFSHDWDLMAEAMRPANREKGKWGIDDLKAEYLKPEYTLYVEVFDEFWGYLDQVSLFVRDGLIKPQHLVPLVYLLERLKASKIFNSYLSDYEVDSVDNILLLREAALAAAGKRREPPRWLTAQ